MTTENSLIKNSHRADYLVFNLFFGLSPKLILVASLSLGCLTLPAEALAQVTDAAVPAQQSSTGSTVEIGPSASLPSSLLESQSSQSRVETTGASQQATGPDDQIITDGSPSGSAKTAEGTAIDADAAEVNAKNSENPTTDPTSGSAQDSTSGSAEDSAQDSVSGSAQDPKTSPTTDSAQDATTDPRQQTTTDQTAANSESLPDGTTANRESLQSTISSDINAVSADEADTTVDSTSTTNGTALTRNDLFPTYMLLGVLLVALAIASLVGQYLRRQPSESVNPALVRRFRQRVNAWWLMSAILAFSLAVHPVGIVVLFFLTSFWALREFITMAPTRRGDHRALFWALIFFTPLQYSLIGIERIVPGWDFYGLYSIMIPVYASIFVPARIALAGDSKRFLERSAQITSGLLICVYALSHAPALLNLQLHTSTGQKWTGSTAGLLCFFVLLTQLSEILQWTWGQVVGRRMIAAEISTSRTWEGFLGGTLSLGLVGAVLWWVTPFTIWEAACMSMVVGAMGMFGGMTMSAIKRDRGVTDYGSLVLGHAGVLDRIDTLCFAAPVFYHLTRFFYTS